MKSAQRKAAMKKWLPWIIAILLINTGACVSLCFFEFRLLPIVLGVLSLLGSMAVFYFTCGEKRNFWIVIMMISMAVVIRVSMP